jgi:hypothetical protein
MNDNNVPVDSPLIKNLLVDLISLLRKDPLTIDNNELLSLGKASEIAKTQMSLFASEFVKDTLQTALRSNDIVRIAQDRLREQIPGLTPGQLAQVTQAYQTISNDLIKNLGELSRKTENKLFQTAISSTNNNNVNINVENNDRGVRHIQDLNEIYDIVMEEGNVKDFKDKIE